MIIQAGCAYIVRQEVRANPSARFNISNMKKFKLIIDVVVQGNDDITFEELRAGIDICPDVDWDEISYEIKETSE